MRVSMNLEERKEWLIRNHYNDSTSIIRADRDGLSPKEVAVWLSATEAGERLGVSGQYVKTLGFKGECECIPTALGWLFEPDSIEDLRKERLEKKREALRRLEEDE